MHNQELIAQIQQIADVLNEKAYLNWRAAISHHRPRTTYMDDVFSMLRENNIASYYERKHFVHFSPVRDGVVKFISHLPHMVINPEHLQESFIHFYDDGATSHRFLTFMELVESIGAIGSDKLEPGMGEEMPYHLSVRGSFIHFNLPDDENGWQEMIPLCNDFLFYSESETTYVKIFFRDEEDFLEASILGNSHDNA